MLRNMFALPYLLYTAALYSYCSAGKFFYDRLVSYMSSGPFEPLVLAHPTAIEHWRRLMGPTKSYVARATAPNTIRGTYGLTDTRNSTHGSGAAIMYCSLTVPV